MLTTRLAQFTLPDLGEGLTEGEILRWLVAPGDTITLNQPIVEVETAKAAVEVPSPYAGVVVELHHAAGEVVDVGTVIITVDTDPAAGPYSRPADPVVGPDSPPADPAVGGADPRGGATGSTNGGMESAVADGKIGGVAPGGRTAVLVGYGPKSGPVTRRPRAVPPPVAIPEPAVPPLPPPATAARVSAAAVGQAAALSAGAVSVLAKPPIRKLARELGVELTALVGTGPHGTVSRTDVLAAAGAREAMTAQAEPVPAVRAAPGPGQRESRTAIKGVRKHTAAAMVASAFTAPHVTEFVTLDITPSMELVTRLRAMPDFDGIKVTPLLLVARALLLAVRRNPEVNATWDDASKEIVVKHYVHLGIAAATPRGLVVPNIKDADSLSLVDLARALQALTETARQGRTSADEMSRGTITITNVGMFGVDSGTPIINPGESAILCFGAVRPMPWVHEGELAVRQVTQLSLSFDHRNIDGQLGSQFLSDIARLLSDPLLALAWS